MASEYEGFMSVSSPSLAALIHNGMPSVSHHY